VGGEILALAIELAAKNARFVICGLISGYNEAASRTPINMTKLLLQGAR
jgi:NADPH-dependent curcumin reductase CurA